MKKKFDIEDSRILEMEDSRIHEMAEQIMNKRDEIIELFVKTFLAVQDVSTTEALKDLFALVELECTMGDNMTQTFRINLRNAHDE